MAQKHNVHQRRVNLAIQTNGTLLDADWCWFFATNSFLVGVPLDGQPPNWEV